MACHEDEFTTALREASAQDCLTWLESHSNEDLSKLLEGETFYDSDSAGPSSLFQRWEDQTFFLSRSNSLAASHDLATGTPSTITSASSHCRSPSSFTIRGRRQRRQRRPPPLQRSPSWPMCSLTDVDVNGFSVPRGDDWQHEGDELIEPAHGSEEMLLAVDRPGNRCLTYGDSTVTEDGHIKHEHQVPSSTNMTKKEFDALPRTIQRKCFTVLERHQFSQPPVRNHSADLSTGVAAPPPSVSARFFLKQRRPVQTSRPPWHLGAARHRHKCPPPDEEAGQFYANLPDKIKRRHLTEDEQLLALTSSPGAGKPRRRFHRTRSLDGGQPDGSADATMAMATFSEEDKQQQYAVKESEISPDPVYESLRFLETDEAPDLRLYLDDYHINLREEVPVSSKTRQPSFRRHLSISRIPFSRPSLSMSSTGARDCTSPVSFTSTSAFSASSSGGTYSKRQSKILSLIQNSRQNSLRPTSPTDVAVAAAAHYQDSEARKTLRACLATPQGFDEALAYGFPSIDENFDEKKPYQLDWEIGGDSDSLHKWHTFFEDDDNDDDEASTVSDNATASEEETPQTPKLDKALPGVPSLGEREFQARPRLTQQSVSSYSREMTMRMTLTRPDLRADEDGVFGQKGYVARRTHSRGGSMSPMLYIRESTSPDPKTEMEKRFAEFDYEDAVAQSPNTVKRLWNRVRW